MTLDEGLVRAGPFWKSKAVDCSVKMFLQCVSDVNVIY